MAKRPTWWPDWYPKTCTEGHDLNEGISLSWESCPGCPGAEGNATGHHVVYCRINGCRAEPTRPPGHVGPGRPQGQNR